jgi:hypothetical protein
LGRIYAPASSAIVGGLLIDRPVFLGVFSTKPYPVRYGQVKILTKRGTTPFIGGEVKLEAGGS